VADRAPGGSAGRKHERYELKQQKEAILHRRRIHKSFPALKKKKNPHRKRTIHIHSLNFKSQSSGVLNLFSSLYPQP